MTKRQLKKLGSVQELSKRFGRSRSTIYRWIREGPPKSIDIGSPTTPKRRISPKPIKIIRKEGTKKQREVYLKEQTKLRESTKKVGFVVESEKKEQRRLFLEEQTRLRDILSSKASQQEFENRRIHAAKLAERKRQLEEQQFLKEHLGDVYRKITINRSKATLFRLIEVESKIKKSKSKKLLVQHKILSDWLEQSENNEEYFDPFDVEAYAELYDIDIHEAYDQIYGYG